MTLVRDLLTQTFRAAICASLAAALLTPATATATGILGSAGNFAVLGGSTVTNTGSTSLVGDLGVYPGSAITGLGSITLTGSAHLADVVAQQAHSDAAGAYVGLSAVAFTHDLTGQDLGSVGVLTPGVYKFSSSALLNGNLTLDFASDSDEAFVFQIGSAFISGSASSITVLNGGPRSGIFWEVGTSATLGTGTLFAGNILADQSITLNTGAAILCGSALAINGAVTMDGNRVSNNCGGEGDLGSGRTDYGSHGFSGVPTGSNTVPEPAAWAMMLMGFGLVGAAVRRGTAAARLA